MLERLTPCRLLSILLYPNFGIYYKIIIYIKLVPLNSCDTKRIIPFIFLFAKNDTKYEFSNLDDLMTIVNAHHLNHLSLEVKARNKKVFDKIQMCDGLGQKIIFMKRLFDI